MQHFVISFAIRSIIGIAGVLIGGWTMGIFGIQLAALALAILPLTATAAAFDQTPNIHPWTRRMVLAGVAIVTLIPAILFMQSLSNPWGYIIVIGAVTVANGLIEGRRPSYPGRATHSTGSD